MQNCHHINLLTYYSTYRLQGVLQTIRLFISDWDGWCDWLQTTAEHDVVWIIWAGDRRKLSCAHLNGELQFHAKSHELISAFLACPPDWARGPLLLCDECAVSRCLIAEQLYPFFGFSLADFQLSNRCQEIYSASFVHHTALTDRDFKSKWHLPMKYLWFCLIFFKDIAEDVVTLFGTQCRKVQMRATKRVITVKTVKHLAYMDRLICLYLPTLKYRRIRGDMIEVYKIVTSGYDIDLNLHLQQLHGSVIRGHNLKLATTVSLWTKLNAHEDIQFIQLTTV